MTQQVSEYYRFCPDQPKVLISDAVCISRRRVHYAWCAGCRFNDDEKAAKTHGVASSGQPGASAKSKKRPPAEPEHPRHVQIEIEEKHPAGTDTEPPSRDD